MTKSVTNDPNSYNADIKTVKKAMNIRLNEKKIENEQLKVQIDDLQKQIQDLNNAKIKVETDLFNVLNSKGWKMLEKMRKMNPMPRRASSLGSNPEPRPAEKAEKAPAVFPVYNSHYEDNIDFSKLGHKPEVKALAFYLPQFHTFQENDEWWGKGFTEWTNTKKSKPRFEGHYQPREPHEDIGYYTLDNVEAIKKQVALAKQHGLYGFCFYYYWFSGKRLMEKPIDLFLGDKSIDFPFCLCWANENWTRTWDGMNKDVLIKQEYKKNDPEKFILDMKKYLLDSRYIRVDGKPVILVYEPNSIPDFEKVVDKWRETARKNGIGEIAIWSKSSMADIEFKNVDFVDAEFDFAPVGHGQYLSLNSMSENKGHYYYDYRKTVEDFVKKKIYYDHTPVAPFYYSATMGWDNSARKKKEYWVLGNYSPEKFYEWLRIIIEETKRRQPEDKRFIFINAWNEWAEGTYLEPDKKYGYTNINTVSKAIYGLPYGFDNDKKRDVHT